MNFLEAMTELMDGKQVRRHIWKKGTYVYITDDRIPSIYWSDIGQPEGMIEIEDMLCKDWELIKKKKKSKTK